MRELFGPEVDWALATLHEEMTKTKAGESSELMDLLIAKDWKSLFNIPDVRVASAGSQTSAVQTFDPAIAELIPSVQLG